MADQKKTTLDFEALAREAEEANAKIADGGESDPFGGASTSIEVTKEINLAQFQQEISEKVGSEVQVALAIGLGQIASAKRPGTLYVSPATVTDRALRDVYERHQAKQPEQPQQSSESSDGATVQVTLDDDAKAALEKAQSGKTLTTKELTSVITALASALGQG